MKAVFQSVWQALLDHPEQIGIALLGATAIWMVGRKKEWRKWGYAVGLASQPFWLYATWEGRQWGMFALSVWYVYAWASGWWNNRHAQDIESRNPKMANKAIENLSREQAVKAHRYKVEISDGVLDWTHGFTYSIEEIFIPDLDLFVNIKTAWIGTQRDYINRRGAGEVLQSFDLTEQQTLDCQELKKHILSREATLGKAQAAFGFLEKKE